MSRRRLAQRATAVPPSIPVFLETERLLLRCPAPGDGPALHAALLDSVDSLRPWFAWLHNTQLNLQTSEATVCYTQWLFQKGSEFQFYLFLKGTETMIGVCGLCRPEWTERRFELSYWLRHGYEGRGYMTEAAVAVTNLAFDAMGAGRVEIQCDAINEVGIAVARRLGYVYEKTVPGARRDPGAGEWRDVMIFARRAAAPAAHALHI